MALPADVNRGALDGRRLAQAKDRPEFVTGDLVDDLASAADRIPAELPLVVFNSHVLPYVPGRHSIAQERFSERSWHGDLDSWLLRQLGAKAS